MPEPPPPPQAPAATAYTYETPAPAPAAPAGQWVYTTQYGWIWAPYDASYTYVPGADVAYTFAYYPRIGWRWVASPWVLGLGPTPVWGRLGPVHFAWYGHPGFHGRVIAPGGWYGHPVNRPAPRVAWHGSFGRVGHHR
jgi:hypothetical protein